MSPQESNDEVQFFLLGGGGSPPTAAEVIQRLRNGAVSPALPPSVRTAAQAVEAARVALSLVADNLDAQSLGVEGVQNMTLQEVGAAFEDLNNDGQVLDDHTEDAGGHCSADGEPWPCSPLRLVFVRYLGPDTPEG